MKKTIKLLALITAITLLLAGCGSGGKEPSASTQPSPNSPVDGSANDTQAEVKDMKMFVYTYMNIPDSTEVVAKINETMNPLGVNVVMEWTNAATVWDELQMKIAGGEQVDLCALTDNRYTGYIGNGSLLAIDEYLNEYGQDITAAFDKDLNWLLDAVKFNGKTYAIPVIDNKFQFVFAGFNTAYLDKYNLDISSIKSYKDMTPILDVAYQNEPELKTLISGTQAFSLLTIAFNGHDDFESLGDGLGVLMGKDNWDVVNLYETEEYAEFCKDMHAWYKAGYISSDTATSGENYDTYWKTGNAFAYMQSSDALDTEATELNIKRQYGIDTTVAPIGAQKAVFLKFLQVIPVTSKNPEGAMIFLNELYKNSVLIDTLFYGIEGVDYERTEDGLIKRMEGSQYGSNNAFTMMNGNTYLSTDIAERYKGYNNDCREALKNSLTNRSLGFYFDSTNVTAQYTAVKNVISQYEKGLEYGLLDPEVELPTFIEKLKAAGIDDIIAEKQAQLDAWVEANDK